MLIQRIIRIWFVFALQENLTEAQKLHYKYIDIIASMFAEGSPSGVKAYLSEMGLCRNYFRQPVWKVSEKHHAKDQGVDENYIRVI